MTPTGVPTGIPSTEYTHEPSTIPSSSPTVLPSDVPTESPSSAPSTSPSAGPTVSPSSVPSVSPTSSPTASPTSGLTHTWTRLGGDIDGGSAGDWSGHAIALSSNGSALAVGAPSNNGSAGLVRVYHLINGAWTQRGGDIRGETAGDQAGYSVSLSSDGTILAVGEYGYDFGGRTDAGRVRVYQYVSGAWTRSGGDITGETAGDYSGYSVSLSSNGSVLAVGAPFNPSGGNRAGHVRVYQFANGSWKQRGIDIDGEVGDESGRSVSLSSDGGTFAVGEPGNKSSAGRVRVYQYANGAWIKLGGNIEEGAGYYDETGYSVSLSGDGTVVAVGTPLSGIPWPSWAGHVRVYQFANGVWTQRGGDIKGEVGDESGRSVSLSIDGSVVAVGEPGSKDSGRVRVYQYINGVWTQRGINIDAEAAGDLSGCAVSLSGNGSVLAVGAMYNDPNNRADAGHVRVHQNNAVSLTFLAQTNCCVVILS